jgi:hypothetical protein
MDKVPVEKQSHLKTQCSLHVVRKSSRDAEVQIESSRTLKRTWLGVAVIALFGCAIIGLVLNNKRTNTIQRPSPEQGRINDLAEQLSSLTQADLIVFPDGRVWYVRSVHGKNLEVVGWVGGNARSEDIDSFVLREDHVTIVRHDQSAWPVERDRFLAQ